SGSVVSRSSIPSSSWGPSSPGSGNAWTSAAPTPPRTRSGRSSTSRLRSARSDGRQLWDDLSSMGSESDGEQAPHSRWSARGVRQRVRWMVDTLGSTHVEAAQTHVEFAELKRRLEKIDAEQSRAL